MNGKVLMYGQEVIVAGGKIYARCDDCRSLVRLNKPLIGAMHFCLTPEELAMKKQQEQFSAAQTRKP